MLIVSTLFTGSLYGDTEDVTFDHQEEVRVDERFDVTVEGLPEDENVTLKMTSQDYWGRDWSNEKEFYSEDGKIELSENETMSMIQMKEPVDEGVREQYLPPVEFWEHEGLGGKWNLTLSVTHNNETLESSNVTRIFGDPDVINQTVEDDDIIGEVFLPPGDESVPGVLVLHGSGGRKPNHIAHLLASNGFAALSIKYFGPIDGEPVEQIPENLEEIPLEYIEKSGEWLLNHEQTEGDQVGIMGYSKGGELALLSSSYFDIFGPTVSMVGSGVVWEGSTYPTHRPVGTSTWSYQNDSVPYVPFRGDNYSYSLQSASEETVENATISVENIEGPILAVCGKDDQVWNSVETTEIAMERLQKDNFGFEFEHLVYEDAGHSIRFPYLPTANWHYEVGGTPEGYAEASSNHWPRVLETFEKLEDPEDPEDEEERDWLPYLGIAFITLIVLVVAGLLIKKGDKSKPPKKGENSRGNQKVEKKTEQGLEQLKKPPPNDD